MSYAYWQAALAGEKPKMFVDHPECGFYRKGIHERNAKGNNKRVGWAPVAVFMDGKVMTARVGNRDVSGDDLNDLWSYIAGNPISEEAYRAVAERNEPWPGEAPSVPAANRDVTKADNSPPETLTDTDHAALIDNAIGVAKDLSAVTNETEAAQMLGLKNRIAELRLAADKAGKALYDPPYREYKRLHGLWSPMVARADAAEKVIQKSILTFREKERLRVAAAQVAAEVKQRELDESNERAAQRAIAAGVPEEVPEVIKAEPVAAHAPLLPTYGTRSIKEELHTILDAITDYDAVYNFLKSDPDVKALLLKLATAKVKAGFTVPGTTTREGLI